MTTNQTIDGVPRADLESICEHFEFGRHWQAMEGVKKLRALLDAPAAPGPLLIPDECPHIIVFDDTEREQLLFAGAGARDAALKTWDKISNSWNAHLFVRVERNSRDDRYPSAAFEQAGQPQCEPVADVHVMTIDPNYPNPGRQVYVNWRHGQQESIKDGDKPYAQPPAPVSQKYDDTLLPFLALMRKELHANAGKGDRPGWLAMSSDTCLLEIIYHFGKLQASVKRGDGDGMAEYGADVANLCMMLLDICGVINLIARPSHVNPPPGTEPSGTHHDNDGLDEWRKP